MELGRIDSDTRSATYQILGELVSLNLDFFTCKAEIKPHSLLGCEDFMKYQIILGPPRTACSSLCNQNCCQLNICQENGTEELCDCLSTALMLFTQTGNPRGGFLKGTIKADGTLDLICRNFICTAFRILAHCRPAEGRQYHRVAAEGGMMCPVTCLSWAGSLQR